VSDPWPNPNELTSLGHGETLGLEPGQEHAFYHDLGQHPSHELDAVIIVPNARPAQGGQACRANSGAAMT
jgi:hypothetical protein